MCTPNQENFFINQIEMQPAFIDSQIFVIQVYVIYVSMPILCKYAVFIDNIFPSALPGNFSAGPNNTTGLMGFWFTLFKITGHLNEELFLLSILFKTVQEKISYNLFINVKVY